MKSQRLIVIVLSVLLCLCLASQSLPSIAFAQDHDPVWDTGTMEEILEYVKTYAPSGRIFDPARDDVHSYFSFPHLGDYDKAQELIDGVKEVERLRNANEGKSLFSLAGDNIWAAKELVTTVADILKMEETTTTMVDSLMQVGVISTDQGNLEAGQVLVTGVTENAIKVGQITVTEHTSAAQYHEWVTSYDYSHTLQLDWSKLPTIQGSFKAGVSKLTIAISFWDVADASYTHWENMKDIADIGTEVVPTSNIRQRIKEYETQVEKERIAYDIIITVAGVCGAVIGKWVGVATGTFIGGAIGGAIGGVGALPGATVGAIAGAIAGAAEGRAMAKEAAKLACYGWLDSPLYKALSDIGIDIGMIQAEIIDIYSEGNDNFVPTREKLYVQVKNTGIKDEEFIVSPWIASWEISDCWQLLPWPTPFGECLDWNNYRKIKIPAGQTVTTFFALEPDPEEKSSLVGFTLYVEEGGFLGFFTHLRPLDTILELFRHSSIDPGLEWLRGRQGNDGSWYGDPAVTSFAVLSMLNWGYSQYDTIVSKGLGYILSRINADGSVHNNPNRYTYYTSIAILPLAATGNPLYHDEIQDMRDWLIGSQWDESSFYGSVGTGSWYYGGFGYGSSTRPDLSNTQWALAGLKAADRVLGLEAADTYTKAADYFLKRCQKADGGSAYTPIDGSSIHTMTAASVWSYALCGRGDSDEALAGIKWLADRYSLTNNDGWGWWSEYYYKVTLAKALTMTHKAKLGKHDWFRDLAQKLADEQNADGSWPDTGMMGRELSTCWAIMALQTRTLPPTGKFGMWATLESHCDLHMYDPMGRHTGINYLTGAVEESIPGSDFKILDPDGNEVPYSGSTPDDGYRQVIELSGLMAGSYRIELVGTSDGSYKLALVGLSDGAEVTTHIFEGMIEEGNRLATSIAVTSMEGALTLICDPLTSLPVLGVDPTHLDIVGEPGTTAHATLTVSEIGGEQTLHGVTMYCTDIVGAEGLIAGDDVTFDVNDFDLAPGESQVVNVSAPVPGGFEAPGVGSIVVESIDGGAREIALTLLTDVTGPDVAIVFPTAGLAVQDGVTLAATASDISGVATVHLYVREPDCPQGEVISPEFEDLLATFNGGTEMWEYDFDTLALPDGNYIALAKGVDTYGNEGWSDCAPFSIRNWAVIELLPASQNNKAGRTMPVKFALRVSASVDPAQPFVWNDELTIKIFATSNPGVILQTSTFGPESRDYRIDDETLYITNFKTLKTPKQYTVEIWRTSNNFVIGSFMFSTTK